MKQSITAPIHVLTAVASAAARNNLPLRLLLGVAFVESGFNAAAPRGLFGISSQVAARIGLGESALHDAGASSAAAALELGRLLQRFGGSTTHALAAWCWGESNVAGRPLVATWPLATRMRVVRYQEAGQNASIPFTGPVWMIPPIGSRA